MTSTPAAADPAYLEECKNKAFLLLSSKAAAVNPHEDDGYDGCCLTIISKAKAKIKVQFGATIGAGGATRRYLEAAGFPDTQPLGAMSLVQHETLNLHHHDNKQHGKGFKILQEGVPRVLVYWSLT